MSSNFPDFSTAAYAPVTDLLPADLSAAPEPATAATLIRAILCGLAGAVAGAVLYGGFIHLTHINVGYLAIVIAYLVAKAMMFGSNQRGGRPFQVSAVGLTCLAVAVGNALMLYWSLRADSPIRLSMHNVLQLLRFGFLEPFYEFQDNIGGALLTLFILFIGLRAAWRMTSGVPGAMRHPFSRGF